MAAFTVCKEIKALSNYKCIEKENLFKSTQKIWSKLNWKIICKKLSNFYKDNHLFLSKITLLKEITWLKSPELKEKIQKHVYGLRKLSTYNLKEHFDVHGCPDIITEAEQWEYLYGTYPGFLDQKWKDDLEKNKLIAWLEQRKMAIKYISDHQILEYKINQKYIDNLLSFIMSELEWNQENKSKEHLPGRQHNYFFSREIIYKRLFEWMMKLNSTCGRLYVLINWEEIACIPNFINQVSYEHIFGFKVYPDEPLNSKHFNYDSLIITIGSVFREFSIIPKSTQETKINLILKLKRRINELVKELKSTLIWRYLIEQSISQKSGKLFTINIYSP